MSKYDSIIGSIVKDDVAIMFIHYQYTGIWRSAGVRRGSNDYIEKIH